MADACADGPIADPTLLACPSCRHPDLGYDPRVRGLVCNACAKSYAIHHGVVDLRYLDESYRQGPTRVEEDFDVPDHRVLVEKRGASDVMSRGLMERIRRVRRDYGYVRLLDVGMFMANRDGMKPFLKSIEPEIDLYVGIDPSPNESFGDSVRPERIKLLRAFGEYLPLKSGQFNFAISVASFDHLFDAERCLDEIRRRLTPNGELYIQLNNDGAWFKRLLPNAADRHRARARRWHNYFWTPAQFRELLVRHGFEIRESIGYRFNPAFDNSRLAAMLPTTMQAGLTRTVDWVGNRLARDLGGNFAITSRAAV